MRKLYFSINNNLNEQLKMMQIPIMTHIPLSSTSSSALTQLQQKKDKNLFL